jgi:hypothetical protein
MATLTAPVKWAQRKDSVFLTISLPDVTDAKIDISGNSVTFRSVAVLINAYYSAG